MGMLNVRAIAKMAQEMEDNPDLFLEVQKALNNPEPIQETLQLIRPNGLACYPGNFKGCKVSKEKICVQWEPTQVKLRHWNDQGVIKTVTSDRALPITVTGTELGTVAVGNVFPVFHEMFMGLLSAMDEHSRTYGPEALTDLRKRASIELSRQLSKNYGGNKDE